MKKSDKKTKSKDSDFQVEHLEAEIAPSIESQIREQVELEAKLRAEMDRPSEDYREHLLAQLNVGRRAVGRLVDPTPDSISFQDDVREVAVKVTEMPDKKHFLINAGCKTAVVHDFQEASFVVRRFFREEYKSFFEKEKKK